MSDKKNPPAPTEEETQFGDELPVLPIRNAVLFPGAVAPFDVGRETSVALVAGFDNLSGPVSAIFAQRAPHTRTSTTSAEPRASSRPSSTAPATTRSSSRGSCASAWRA